MIVPDVENVCTDSYLVHDFFDFSYAVLSQLKPNFGFLKLPNVTNVCTDYYSEKVFFDFSYASLSQLKLNFVLLQRPAATIRACRH